MPHLRWACPVQEAVRPCVTAALFCPTCLNELGLQVNELLLHDIDFTLGSKQLLQANLRQRNTKGTVSARWKLQAMQTHTLSGRKL
jgi:hypothetical protein